MLVICLAGYLPPGIDWRLHFYSATLAMLRGESPYGVTGVCNPPWLFVALIPAALFGEQFGALLLFAASIIAIGATMWKLSRGKWWAAALGLTCPLVLAGLYTGNVDALALCGLVMPAPLGLLFLAIKPQIGAVAIVWRLARVYQSGGWREVAKAAAPLTALSIVSLAVFGTQPIRAASDAIALTWNCAPARWIGQGALVVGVLLAIVAVMAKERGAAWAVTAGAFVTPYLGGQSLGVIALPFMASKWQIALGVWLVSWAWIIGRMAL
jgi:hypothetical protein